MRRLFSITTMIPFYIVAFIVLICVVLFTSNTVSTIAEEQAINNRTCVIIDPGHGGVDGGATSCNGILESQLNLEISLRLNDLMHLIGLDTIMIRETDCSVYTHGKTIAQKKVSDLKERVRIVNEHNNALLVSIHQNHFSDSRYYGPQVFYGKIGESREFAQRMQIALTTTLCPESNRKAKSATGVYLMDKVLCEGVLVECGFLSNYEEEAKLRDPQYQKKLCSIIATVCSTHFNGTRIT